MNLLCVNSVVSIAVRNATKSAAPSGIMGLGKSKKKVTTGGASEKIVLPVETDPERLVNYCCGSNIYTTGEDVKLKPDSEYPDWIWTMRTGPKPPLKELDPSTKEYWLEVRRLGMIRNNILSKYKKFR